jgi:sortase A
VIFSRAFERALLVTGVILCLIYVGSRIDAVIGSRSALRAFQASRPLGDSRQERNSTAEQQTASVNHDLWSDKRIAAYLDAVARHFDPPLAVLRLPKVNIEVPVFEGTDELVLNRGVGLIVGTALPGRPGNVGIAGHRDGFFRGLKDVAIGDSLTLTTATEMATYVVERIMIVSPSDVSVLGETSEPSVTLVTCYPFYFVGHAPQRYIVRCSLQKRVSMHLSSLGSRGQAQ